jgi:small subunit ribosomal protein S15
VLKDHNLLKEIPEDLMDLIKRSIVIKTHRDKNHKDMTAKRGFQLTESKIRRLIKYYKASGRLSIDWKYDPERIKLLID